MLTLLLSVLVNVGWGQINSEYRFIQYEVPDTYPHEEQDTVVRLAMDCLAANGYGQWTASSATNTQPTTGPLNPSSWPQSGWFLLGNRIDKSINPTGSTAKSTPPGVVDKGTFGDVTYPAHMKVAANLDSRVRYVWPNPTGGRNTFKVFGLSERSSPFTLTDQIDISFAGFPNPPISRKVVREPITPYTNATTNNKPVSNEVFWQDEFDIAIDKNYLYIVWSTDVPFGGVGREVWATVLDLVNGLPINGNYPMRISVDGHKPTVACDVRNTGGEKFHVSCIGKTIPNIQLYDVQAAITTPIALSNFYDDPDGGPQIPLTNITHARVLHATLQEAPSFITALYVIADQNLLLYNNALTGVNAKYVDGDRIPPVKPCVEKASPFEGYKVKDAPIVAFTDPYGGDIAQPPFFNQFHVLYQLDNPTIEGQVVPRFPLVIVRNYDNGFTVPGSPKTRLCLNVNSGIAEADVENATVPAPTEEFIPASIHNDDPDTYVAAVNQMGIHVHWRTAGTNPTHFYARDINRTFNENIEEHTLVSNDCWVGDHTPLDGASGATVLPGKRLTVWSDPNWGYANNGVLASNLNLVNRGKLKFKGNNVALHIGIPNYTEGQPSKLVTLSHFLCVFPSAYSNQVLQVMDFPRFHVQLVC